ncbi:MAG: MarR family transcriptional regulator [Candidatus Andeanibacterium colombiense]|uniref:MarR family transcriptional regulator n=1 Tax=Candidatus Andeanibacterium colombiense TaxID=3121345 RepID=A0AAJ5X7F9_9SPHN|nr:MAG: MarR family transcriptional regulator [Sphingomonadaceae bacterium]
MADVKPLRGRNSFELYREGNTHPEIRLTIALVLAGRRWRTLLDEKFRPLNQSAARMEALAAIINSPPLSAQVDIAKRLRIEGPTLTRMLDALEADGLVQRLPDPADRRTKQLKVTPAGEAALKDMFDIADELRNRLFEDYTDEQIDLMNELCWGVVNKLADGLPPCV